LFYFDGETALVACVLRAQLKKSSTFLRKKVHPGDLARGFSDLENDLAPLLRWHRHCAEMQQITNDLSSLLRDAKYELSSDISVSV